MRLETVVETLTETCQAIKEARWAGRGSIFWNLSVPCPAFLLVGGKMLAAALLQPFTGPEMYLFVSNFSDSHADRIFEYQYTKYRLS